MTNPYSFTLTTALDEVDIHPEVLDAWTPQVTDKRLKVKLARDDRTAARVMSSIVSMWSIDVQTIPRNFPQKDAVTLLMAQDKNILLRRIGALWHAPQLAPAILIDSSSEILKSISRSLAREVVAFHTHTRLPIGQVPKTTEALDASGLTCLRCWVETLPKAVAAPMLVSFPYQTAQEFRSIKAARASIVSHVVDDLGAPLREAV